MENDYEYGLPIESQHYLFDDSALLDEFHTKTGTERGKVTKKVYELIGRRHYVKAVDILSRIPLTGNGALSLKVLPLLAYCHYQRGNFSEAARTFETLWNLNQKDVQVALTLVHCLARDDHGHEALRVLDSIEGDEHKLKLQDVRLALAVHTKNVSEAEKLFTERSPDALSVDYTYGQYLLYKQQYSEAAQVFQNIEDSTEEQVSDLDYAQTLCMYNLEDQSTAITKAAGIYDNIVQKCPVLGLSYNDDRTVIYPEAGNYMAESGQIASALVLQAGCYFQQEQPRTGRNQLALIPTGVGIQVADKVQLARAVLDSEVDSPTSLATLENLANEASDPHIWEQAERSFLIMYLRHGQVANAEHLIDTQEDSLRKAFTEVDWHLAEAALIASIDTLSARKSYLQIIAEAEHDIERLQQELARMKNIPDEEQDEHGLRQVESLLETQRKSLRTAAIGVAKLSFDKGDYEESVKCLQKYVEHCQDDLPYCTALAHCLFMNKKYSEAALIYETIIKYYKDTQFTLASVPVHVLSCYCAAQSFVSTDDSQAKELLAELARSEKVNYEDPESEYHIVAAKRSHTVTTALIIASAHLEKGCYLEAVRKAKEVVHIHPWHMRQENNSENCRQIWTSLKTIVLRAMQHFVGLLTVESTKFTGLLADIICDLRTAEKSTCDIFVSETQQSGHTDAQSTIAEEIRKLRELCQAYYAHQGGRPFGPHSDAKPKLILPPDELQNLRGIAGLPPV